MDELKKQYTNPALPGSFSGKTAFLRALRRRGKKVVYKEVDDYLKDEETYTLHRPNRKKYQRNQVIVSGIDDTFQADLIDVSNISHFNDNIKFLLTCIDVFSKYAWVVPLKKKMRKGFWRRLRRFSHMDAFRNGCKQTRETNL